MKGLPASRHFIGEVLLGSASILQHGLLSWETSFSQQFHVSPAGDIAMKKLRILCCSLLSLFVAADCRTALSAVLPTVSVQATDPSGAEAGRETGTFTVSRSGTAVTQALTLGYTLSGTAANATDYDRLTGTVTIPAGQSSAAITVRPIDDTVAEPNEVVTLTISNSAAYTVSRATATVTIIDNDCLVNVTATDPSASESMRDPAVFTLTRTGSAVGALTVAYTVSGTATNYTDYAGLTGKATFVAGQSSATVVVTPVDDSIVDPDETVVLTVIAQTEYRTGSSSSATARIADNDVKKTISPVLMVIANTDFYYREYSETRAELVKAGVPVAVAAAQRAQCVPHPGSGQGADGGVVMPDLDLANANAANYSAIVFVGGWGASSYQYAFTGTYQNGNYNGTVAVRTRVNQLINDFQSQGKYVTAICHGVSVLAWARVNGKSPIAGRNVAGYHGAAPTSSIAAATTSEWHIQQNGATMFGSGAIGNPATVADDVYVDGKLITAENYDTASRFGQVIAQQLLK